MSYKIKMQKELGFPIKILTNSKSSFINLLLYLKEEVVELKIKIPYINLMMSHVKSILEKLGNNFLFIWKFIKKANHTWFKKRFVIPSVAIIVFLTLSISAVFLYNIVNDSKDYIAVLAAQNDNKKEQNQDTKSKTSGKVNNSSSADQKTPYVNKIENRANVIKRSNKSVITVLLLGIDRTEERDKTIGVFRSDTIALASINRDTKEVKVLSIPRDTYAFIPIENKKDKINHAYAFGSKKGDGVQGSIDAIEKFIKYAKIDYYFAIDMQLVPEIVNMLGGIEVNVDFEIKNELHKGKQLLDGQKALEYIRYRYTPGGDIDRIIHQRKFACVMLSKLKESDPLIDAVSIILNYHKFVKTNMSLKQLAALARLWVAIPSGNSDYYIVPGEDTVMNRIWYYMPDLDRTESLLKMIFK